MQSINTDVWLRGRQSEKHVCAKKKKIKSMKPKHRACLWDKFASNQCFFLHGVKTPICSGANKLPEGSIKHTTMAGFKLHDPQTGGSADAAVASRDKIFKKIAFIEDSLVYTLIYAKGTQK